MISVDQILLLQNKVESAVQKIEQLKSENDALRTKCSELTNALSEKTELLANFEADGKKIEDGILTALSRLDSVENTLLDNAGQNSSPENGGENQYGENPDQQYSQDYNEQEQQALYGQNNGQENYQAAEGEMSNNNSEGQYEFGADQNEANSLFGDTSFETEGENNNPPEDIY